MALLTQLIALLALVPFIYIVLFLVDPYGLLRARIPGPLFPALSDIWLAWVAGHGHRSLSVHTLHQIYGPIVRIAPNHVSIASWEAIPIVYGHSVGSKSGTLKSNFYDAFVSIHRGLFNTRDRTQHARKRKIVSNIFAQKSVLEFEPAVRGYIAQLISRWENFCQRGESAKNADSGVKGDEGWLAREGWIWFDCLPWYNYLAFDIIGDLAFGSPFGMIERGEDSALVALGGETAIARLGGGSSSPSSLNSTSTTAKNPTPTGPSTSPPTLPLPAIHILNSRGDFSATLGVLPPALRGPAKAVIPWFRRGGENVRRLAGMAVVKVGERVREGDVEEEGTMDGEEGTVDGEEGLVEDSSPGQDSGDQGAGIFGDGVNLQKQKKRPRRRVDLLTKLQLGKDESGNPMGLQELTAEALTQLIAGSDTTSNSSCAITFYLAQNRDAQRKLHAELDEAFGPPVGVGLGDGEDGGGVDLTHPSSSLRHLPYLEACINEGLRIHSTSGIGLPRVVGEGGVDISLSLPVEGKGISRIWAHILVLLSTVLNWVLSILGFVTERTVVLPSPSPSSSSADNLFPSKPTTIHFPSGTILSVPTYTIHRDSGVWGKDVEAFRPERWFGVGVGDEVDEKGDGKGTGEVDTEKVKERLGRAFNPFSYGPRACVGRNLAQMELQIIIASIFHRFEFVLEDVGGKLETREGFLRKPLGCRVGMRRRSIGPARLEND